MSYQADKPFGRRKTDKSVSPEEIRHWQRIRRDVDEDSTGLIRRYLRLSKKVLEIGNDESAAGESLASAGPRKSSNPRAA
jgi:hypothetical protein